MMKSKTNLLQEEEDSHATEVSIRKVKKILDRIKRKQKSSQNGMTNKNLLHLDIKESGSK